jgi:tyrosyl-DNA phosphodiesterase 2
VQLLTWNVYFGGHMFEERRDRLVAELERRRPEVIALQEVTAEHLQALKELRGYASTLDDSDSFTTAGYGVAIFARVPIVATREFALPSEMGRTLLTVELATGWTIATVHLESLGEHERRIEQLAIIQRRLASRTRAVLCGDFNFTPDGPEQLTIEPSWSDAWAALRPDEPGYSVDTEINSMRYQLEEKRTQKRIDRVLTRGVAAHAIALVGTEPIDVDGTFVSDHFGLVVDVR